MLSRLTSVLCLLSFIRVASGQLENGLLGYWTFDEGTGRIAFDTSGNGNHGTIVGATWTSGITGSALAFESEPHDYTNMGAQASLEVTDGFTVSAWIKPSGSGTPIGGGIIVNKEGEYEIARLPTGEIGFAIAFSPVTWSFILTGYIAPENTWTHLVWTYSASQGEIRLIVNGGSYVFTAPGSGIVVDRHESEDDFRIGGRQHEIQHFDGVIDEVRIYDHALTPDEAHTLFQLSGVPGQDDPPTEPPYDEPQTAGESNAVIITHGWNNSDDPSTLDLNDFWVPLTQEIAGMITAPGDWFVGLYNWVADASTGSNPLTAPDKALNLAQAHGDFLGQWLADQQFNHVHLIAHSAGSALIGRAAYWLSVSPQRPTIHTTFLDPFSGVFVGPSGGYQSLYGGSSDWSDNYFSFDLLTGSPTHLDDLLSSFNVDVTRVDPDWHSILHPFSSHEWPRCFYRFTASGMTLDCYPLNEPPCTTGGLGFPLSRERSSGTIKEWLDSVISMYPVGQMPQTLTCPSLGPEGGNDSDLVFRIRQDDPLNFADLFYQASGDDSVIVSDVGFTATTLDGIEPSAAWINIAVELTALVNFVRFDVEFERHPGARGLLTVYLDGIELGFVDEQYFQTGFNEYSLHSYDDLAGLHNLSFRLDPLASASATVLVTNIRTGRGKFTCSADLNVDDEVGIVDFLAVLAAWGPCPDPPEPCPADIDGDGNVGIVDFLALLANWGPCP